MDRKELKNLVTFELKNNVTLPDLCEKFACDEFVLASIIAELESSEEVELSAFKKIYR